MSVVDEIKSRLDIVTYVQRTVPLKKAGRVWKACCPFHAERTPSFVVREETQSWRCFGACATGGDIFAFAMRQNGWTFNEALQELAKLAGVELHPQTPEQRARQDALDRLRGLLNAAAEFYHERLLDPDDEPAASTLAYARGKRGLSGETLTRFQIGYAPQGWQTTLDALQALGYSEDDLVEAGLAIRNDQGRVYDRFRHRLMIPIRDERGRVVGFGARALAPDDHPKYMNSPQSAVFDKSRLLFGLDFAAARIRDTETAVIVEGYLDAIQAHQAGYSNVVAQMGTALTDTQLKLIAPRWAKKIILSLDSDAAGQNATRRSLEVARETLQADHQGRLGVEFRVLALPGAKDPDDLIRETPERWNALIENAIPVADFVIQMETAELGAKASLPDREAAARRLLPLLLASENDLYRKDNLQKLAIKLRIAERDLMAWASDQQKIATAKAPARIYDSPPDDVAPDFDTPLSNAPERRPKLDSTPRDAALERYCLRVLFRQPELLYHVNRKFRELAGDDGALANGPLSGLGADDFSRSETRALMLAFEDAMMQDDLEPLDHLREHLDPGLLDELEAVLMDEWEGLRPRLRHGLSADLVMCLKQNERSNGVIDISAELAEKTLRLRALRLLRERQELMFLLMEAQTEDEAVDIHNERLVLSITAKRIIDAELQRVRVPR